MSKYLSLLQTHNIEPNFECSREFFHSAKWKEISDGWHNRVTDKAGNQMLPTITDGGSILNDPCFIGLPGMGGPILDYEFIYNPLPLDFPYEGRDWKTTRKNVRRAEKELGTLAFEEIPTALDRNGESYKSSQKIIEKMLLQWGGDKELFGAESITYYALYGQHRLFVRNPQNMLVAVLAWDANYKYINFRVCLAAPVQGLSDWCRVRFRQLVGKLWPEMLINDGGACKNKGLYHYKKRLCPLKINEICTVTRQGGANDTA